MTKQPLVSIIIPTYNRAYLIGETLDSILAQTYQNWECIVVDDGSSDATEEGVLEFVANNDRFRFYKRTDAYSKGGNGARNMGLALSRSEKIMFLDSDDLISNDCLENRISLVKANPLGDLFIFLTGCFHKKIGDSDILWNKVNQQETNNELFARFLRQDMPWHTNGVIWKVAFLKMMI